jgi:hypothetical protein
MVLWEITLATAYVLGLPRTYRLALRLQRRLISPKWPRVKDFVYRYAFLFLAFCFFVFFCFFLFFFVFFCFFLFFLFCFPSLRCAFYDGVWFLMEWFWFCDAWFESDEHVLVRCRIGDRVL